ncbi:MAG: hypothetical protein HY764_01890 [Candidatus Portnoybacteria bacterium]|nr:hypothetical protein [Candidatus Portnoybacteria bacterium]
MRKRCPVCGQLRRRSAQKIEVIPLADLANELNDCLINFFESCSTCGDGQLREIYYCHPKQGVTDINLDAKNNF